MAPADPSPDARRGLRLLGTSFALAWVAISMSAGPGSAAFVALSGRAADAGLFFAVFSLGAAAGGFLGGRLMDRVGRRRPLAAAHAVAALGFAACGWAVARGSLAAFAIGSATLAFGIGAVYLTRVAAAELLPPAERGRGIARVQASATAGAVAAPLLLLLAAGPLGGALGSDPREVVWLLAPPLLLLAAALVLAGPEPMEAARRHEAAAAAAVALAPARAARPPGLPRRPLLAGVATLAVAQAAMVGVMGVTGAALAREGHDVVAMALVMALHFVGMFAFSHLAGRSADRLGRRATILGGLAVLAAGGLVVGVSGGGAGVFALGLLLVGVGWSFAYIAATLLLGDAVPAARRARVVGAADLAAALSAAAAAAASGWWYAREGLPGLGVAAAVAALAAFALVGFLRPAPAPAEELPAPG